MSLQPGECRHLTVEIVEAIHAQAIADFGGLAGTRDRALLESAVAATQASFGGVSPFTDSVDVAAAYLFYLCSNHPFFDGNKRAALGSCIVFLKVNGHKLAPDSENWENLTMAVAAGALEWDEVTAKLRALVAG
jgi:death on curing protein